MSAAAGAASMSTSRPRPRPTAAALAAADALDASLSPSAKLVAPALPQLQLLQKRLGQLARGIQDLQGLLFSHPTLEDWPTLCTRYATLFSHLHNISSSLNSSSAQFIGQQTSELDSILSGEATSANLYAGHPVGTTLGADSFDPEQLPRVRYRDASNLLPELVAHPVLPIKDESKFAALTNALRTRLEPDMEALSEKRVSTVFDEINSRRSKAKRPPLTHRSVPPIQAASSPAKTVAGVPISEADAAELLQEVKSRCDMHDQVILSALRMWHHLERAPDEDGERYDWKMRLSGLDDDVQGDHEAEGDSDVQMGVGPQLAEEDSSAHQSWTQAQAAAFLSSGERPLR